MTIRKWPLDYSWGGAKGWTDFTDVCLEGRIAGPGRAEGVAALRRWIDGLDHAQMRVDGIRQQVHYEGGGYLRLLEGDPARVYIHSHGQDAYDAISHYSGEVAKRLRRSGAEVALSWHRLPHDRTDQVLDHNF